ncbi:MAG: SBBP repeat-containing protein [Deltaproteobacteria bacterium]|nr:SBBP repeat-containing protein [Deltaproteobacteria bacterium]
MSALRWSGTAVAVLLGVACGADPAPPRGDASDLGGRPEAPFGDHASLDAMEGALPDAGALDSGMDASLAEAPPDAAQDEHPDATDGDSTGDLPSGERPALACPEGRAPCDDRCVDLAWDPDHCGRCDRRCPLGQVCSRGACSEACGGGRRPCSIAGAARCVDQLSDPRHCGACDRPCADGQTCTDGRCACAPGFTVCGTRCANLTMDPGACGGCGVTCPAVLNARVTCTRGACGFQCAEGYHACGNACADNTSPLSCGAACTACPAPAGSVATCEAGRCAFRCALGYHVCGGLCVSDALVATCGASCVPCPAVMNAVANCDGTRCGFLCLTNFHRCGDACVANASPMTCGASCTQCPVPPSATATCDGTRCGFACMASFGDCDREAGNGCEVDLRIEVRHCGVCGRSCTAPASATPTCTAGACGWRCNTGAGNCDGNPTNGCETDISLNTAHCGMCGRVCATGEVCLEGACRTPRHRASVSLGGIDEDGVAAVAVARDGTVYVTGAYRAELALGGRTFRATGGTDVLLAAFTPEGVLRWARPFGGAQDDAGTGIVVDASGNLYVTGRFRVAVDLGGGALTTNGEADGFVASFAPDGSHRWSRSFGGPDNDEARAIALGMDGRVVVTGSLRGTVNVLGVPLSGSASTDGFVAALGDTGAARWARRFIPSTTAPGGSQGWALAAAADGSLYVTGLFSGLVQFGTDLATSAGTFDIFVEALSAAGDHRWVRRYGAESTDWGRGIATDPTGNVFLTGYYQGSVDFGGGLLTGGTGTDFFLVSLSPSGAHRWSRRLGGSARAFGSAAGQGLTADSAGNLYASGLLAGTVETPLGVRTSAGASDVLLGSWTPTGNLRWVLRFGGSGSDEATGVAVDPLSRVWAVGAFARTVDFGGGVVTSAGEGDGFLLGVSQ